MKQLFSISAIIVTTLFFAACSKSSVMAPLPAANGTVSSNKADTPYVQTNTNPGDTPYYKNGRQQVYIDHLPVIENTINIADTPYRTTLQPADTPYLRK